VEKVIEKMFYVASAVFGFTIFLFPLVGLGALATTVSLFALMYFSDQYARRKRMELFVH